MILDSVLKRVLATSVLALTTLFSSLEGAINSPEGNLIESLLFNSSRFARPTKNASKPVKVEFGIELVQLQELKWVNELMVWNPNNHDGVKSVMLNADEVWVPDIVLYNRFDIGDGNKDDAHNKFLKTQLHVFSDGTVYWKSPATYVSTCQLHIANFPYDSQECYLKFGPWSSDVSKVDIITDSYPLTTSAYIENNEWILDSISKTRNYNEYACCTYGYADVTITMKIRRKPLFYIFNFIVPYVVLLVCLWIGYLVPPQSGERISLSLTILLAFSIFVQTSSTYLPRSAELSLLSILYFVVMNEVALSALITCLVVNVFYTADWGSKAQMPAWVEDKILRNFEALFKKIGFISSFGGDSQQSKTIPYDSKNNASWLSMEAFKTVKCSDKKRKSFTDMGSELKMVDYSPPDSERSKTESQKKPIDFPINRLDSSRSERLIQEIVMNESDELATKAKRNRNKLSKVRPILKLLRYINKQRSEESSHKDSGEKWKRLAAVLDRLFFFFFMVFTVLTFIAFTVIEPILRK